GSHYVSFRPSAVAFVSCFFLSSYADPRDLHSFPTRRSSDLERLGFAISLQRERLAELQVRQRIREDVDSDAQKQQRDWVLRKQRSEEHTSELQSRSDLVCRLLLEQKHLLRDQPRRRRRQRPH